MSITVNAFLTAALTEIRVARGGDVVNPDDMDLALTLFNELLDSLNADDRALYTVAFNTHTLTPSLQPHTIGMAANSPTFSVSVGRPQRILSANIVLADNIRSPVNILNEQEWNAILSGAAAGQAVTITTTIPVALWYRPNWPNGQIFLWPVPTTAYGLELQTETLLASVALADTFDLPFGYQEALRMTVSEKAAPHFGQAFSPSQQRMAREARDRIWGNNERIPDAVADAGVPMGGPARGGYDYRTGMVGR